MGYGAFYVICPRASSQYVTPLMVYGRPSEFYVVQWPQSFVRNPKAEWHPESGRCLGSPNGFSQQGWLRGSQPFLEDKQSLRCCNLLRVPDEEAGRKKEQEWDYRGASSSVRCQGLGRRHGWWKPTGTWRLEETGGTDMAEDRAYRRTKAYDVTVYDKSGHRPELLITFVEMSIWSVINMNIWSIIDNSTTSTAWKSSKTSMNGKISSSHNNSRKHTV